MSNVLTATAVIKAKDETAAAFDAVEARVKAVSKMVREVGRDIARVGKVSGGASEVGKAFKGSAASVDALAGGIARVEKSIRSVGTASKAVAEQLPGLRQAAGAAREAAQGLRAMREEMDRLATASGRLSALREGLSSLGALRREASEAAQAMALLNKETGLGGAGGTAMAEQGAAARTAAAASTAAYREEGLALAALRKEVEATIGSFRSLGEAEAKIKLQAETAGAALKGQGKGQGRAGTAAAVAGAVTALPHEEPHPTAAAGAARGHGAHGGAEKHNSLHQLAEVASLYGTIEAAEVAHAVVERYQEFDKERRYGRVIMGLTDKQQEPLVEQAIHESGNSKFNDIQFLETQRELAARGYDKDQVLGFTPTVAKLGQSFDVSMPEAVKALEGSMLAFHKDVSTEEKAHAVATRTADIQVKASKISGMDFSDIVQLYKYGAAPSKMAGLSEEMLLALGGMAKKNNMRGDESGVMVRALAKGLLSPTLGAQVALQGAGISYSQYQKMPERLDADGYASQIAKRYGIALSEETKDGVRKLFGDKTLIGDAEKFLPAMNDFLKGADVDPKMVKTLLAFTRDFRNKSSTGVDTDGLLKAEIEAISKNPALANAIYGSQQGGRIYAALGDPETLNRLLDLLKNHADGMNDRVATDRMAGFDGALSRLKNSLANVETALGRAFDGAGSGGLMTDATNALARLAQSFAEADPVVQRAVAGLSAVGAAAAALKTFGIISKGFGIAPAAAQLEGSAVQLTAAARALQVAAGEQDIAGAVPGAAGKGAKRAAVHIGEEAAGAAAGAKLAGAAERGAVAAEKGALSLGRAALTAEAVEIAATGVTLSAGTIMLGALAAGVVIDAIKQSMAPKHQAAGEPGFGRPFAPVPGLDLNDPRFKAPEDRTPAEREQLKPWQNKNAGAHPRGTVPSQRDTDLPGHWVDGPRGRRHWALEDRSGPKHPAFFTTAPLGLDGLPTLPMPTGLPADPLDPRTWAHIGANLPAPVHEAVPPSAVPPHQHVRPIAPTVHPAAATASPTIASPSTPASVAPPAAAPIVVQAAPAPAPLATATPSSPVPVHVVSTSASVPAAPLPPGLHRDFTLGNGTGSFASPGMGAGAGFQPFPMHHAHGFEPVRAHAAPLGPAPLPDLSGLLGALSNVRATVEGPITASVTGSADVKVLVEVRATSELLSAVSSAKAAPMALSSGGGVVGASRGGTGVQRTAAAPRPLGQGGVGHQ